MDSLASMGLGNWELTFYASLAYYVDALADEVPAKYPSQASKSSQLLDADFAAKCAAHSLVCWQGSEWEYGRLEFDLLGPSGIDEFPFAHEECPTFVFQMEDALEDILYLPVKSDKVSFGAIKASYR